MTAIKITTLALLSLTALPGSVFAQTSTADFEGVWSGYLTTQEHEVWQLEDFVCFVGCPKLAREHLSKLLDNPANDERPLNDLIGESRGYMTSYLKQNSTPAGLALMASNNEANDTNIECHPYDYARSVTNPLPLKFERQGDVLTIRYEEWNQVRTVYLDGREFPKSITPSSMGYSIGHIENGALVIETRGLVASTYPPITINVAGGHSEQLRGVESYTLTPGAPTVMAVELTLIDPVTLTEPYVYTKRWIATPEVQLLTDGCRDIPGVF